MPTRAGSPVQVAAEPEPGTHGPAPHWRDPLAAPDHPVHATSSLDSFLLGRGSDGRIARRSRLASGALVLLLLGVSGFAIWSSRVTAAAARAAVVATTLSDHYSRAEGAVVATQSLERKYRLEPGSDVQAGYHAATSDLLAALALVKRDGDQSDRVRVEQILTLHRQYFAAIGRLFTAVDNGDNQAVLAIEAVEDPLFDAIVQAPGPEDETHHAEALRQLGHLRSVERLTGQLTPAVILAGLLLALLLTSITRAHRRLLDTERRRALHSSLHDALTGLPNRALLFERFAQALSAAKSSGMAAGLLVIDLNRFKEINETFGHHYGDMLLTQIGPRLRSALREADTVARLGGDEFAILLPDITDQSAATVAATDLLTALEAPFVVEGVALDLEASVGVVLSGQHGSDPTTLLQRADVALQIAKAQNLGVAAYDPDLDGHSPAKLALLGELRRALNLGQLVLHYQPKVDFRTAEVVGAEALVRWQHPGGGLIRPDAFIPMAERTALIGPLTTYVLGAALAPGPDLDGRRSAADGVGQPVGPQPSGRTPSGAGRGPARSAWCPGGAAAA